MRLDKMLAHMNYGSRSEVKKMIRKGFVSVNGVVIKDDDYNVNEQEDEVNIFGNSVSYEEKLYFMLNKPKDVVSATFDYYKKTVIDLFSGYEKRALFPVGRLDIDTTGLLIVTNDGELAHRLLGPKHHVYKTYHTTLNKNFNSKDTPKLEAGVVLDDGYQTLPARVESYKENIVYLSIREGKFHQVKRMFSSIGYEVVELQRVSFGSLELDQNLELGEYRVLTQEELYKLYECSQ